MNATRQIGRGAMIYGLQPVLARSVSILMLPLYTRYLTPADYGVLQLLGATVEIVSILVTSGAITGVTRFYFKRTAEIERHRLLSTAWLLHLAMAVGGGLIVCLLAPIIDRYLLKESGVVALIQLAGLNLATSVLAAVPQLRLQITERAGAFTAVGFVRLVMQLSLNIYFVAVVELGVVGVLLGTLITNVVLGGVLATIMLRETGVHWEREAKEDLLRFGRPSRFTAVGSFILNSGDRYILAAYWPTAVVGTYGLAYQFGNGFAGFFVTPLAKAWDPIRYAMGNKSRDEWEPSYLRIFDLANVLYLTGFVGVVAFIGPMIQILTTPQYFGAAALVPPLVGAFVLQAWTASFAYQLNMAERPALYAKTTWWSIVAVLVLYLVLIPRFGAAGAAWATVGGFGVRCVLTYVAAQRVWPIAYRWDRVRRMSAVAVVTAVLAVASQQLSLWQQLGVATLLVAVFVSITLATVLDHSDRGRLAAILKRLWKHRSLRVKES